MMIEAAIRARCRWSQPAAAVLALVLFPVGVLCGQDASGPNVGELKESRPVVRTPPVVLSQVPPIYPDDMKRSGMKGEVVIAFVVDVHGQVVNPVVVSSNGPEFEDAAIEAVKQWRFKPATIDGRPVNTRLRVPVQFILGGEPDNGKYAYQVDKKSGAARPPTVRALLVPVYPYELRREGVVGHAKAAMTVDEAGKVVKIEISESSRPEFSQALIAALVGFAFNPAVKDGRPVPAVVEYERKFDESDLRDLSGNDLLELEKRHPDAIRTVAELDAIPKPVSLRHAIFPPALAGTVAAGTATVRFLIDEDGHAELPRVIAASDPAFGYAAVEAVSSWIFDPPVFHGHVVAAYMDAPIRFALNPPGK